MNQRCVVCGPGTVAFGPHDESFGGSCWTCPEGARCYGSTMVVPHEGYAAISPLSTNMQRYALLAAVVPVTESADVVSPPHATALPQLGQAHLGFATCRCPNPQACIYTGRQEQLHDYTHSIACHNSTVEVDGTVTWTAAQTCPVSQLAQSLQRNGEETVNTSLFDSWKSSIPQCSPGYQGLLCGQCLPGFGQGQASFTCTPCPSPSTSLAVLLAGVAAVLLVTWYTIHQASMTVQKSSGTCSTKAAAPRWSPLAQLQRYFGGCGASERCGDTDASVCGNTGGQKPVESTDMQVANTSCLPVQHAEAVPEGEIYSGGGYLHVTKSRHGPGPSGVVSLMPRVMSSSGRHNDPDGPKAADGNDMQGTGCQPVGRRVGSPIKIYSGSFGRPGPDLQAGWADHAVTNLPQQSGESGLMKLSQPGPCAESAPFNMAYPEPPPMAVGGQDQKDNVEFQVAKILISYLQVVSVIRDVDMRLPKTLQALFQVRGRAWGGLMSCKIVPFTHHPCMAQLWPALDSGGVF